MDGTVNWANREEGRVVRTGTWDPACGAGAGATGAGAATTLGAVLAEAFAAALAATGTAVLLPAFGAAFAAALDLLVSAFTSWSPRSTGGPRLRWQPRVDGKPSGVLPGRDCIDLGWRKRKRCRYDTSCHPYHPIHRAIRGNRGSGTVFDNPAPTTPAGQARLCSSPCRRMSLGRSMPMKTILLSRSSPSAHCGPRSLPMSWCTPWKITLRSVPFMYSTPL
ncbi:hypothetical protein PMI14_04504 [Acidovorax sp. CF316]|nr:hypothetical protein PMI14_04504 [Acidovorax sp. CF316]